MARCCPKLFAHSAFVLLLALLGAAVATRQPPQLWGKAADTVRAELRGQAAPDSGAVILREGTQFADRLGVFRVSGDRVTFYPEGGQQPFPALENLALERVAQVLSETSGQRLWNVSGTVTEYRGVNYLLVTRAVLKSRYTDEHESR